MAKVIESFVADTVGGQVEFDLYSDDEMLITLPTFNSYTLDSKSVARVREMLGVKAVQKKVEPKKNDLACGAEAVPCERLQPKVRIEHDGWSAAVGYDSANPAVEVRFVYATREKARKSSHAHKVGENGRIR